MRLRLARDQRVGWTRSRTRTLALIACLASPLAGAHEFWIEPESFTPAPGEPLQAALFVGQMMKGYELPYLSHGFESFTVTARGTTQAVSGNEGDSPALTLEATEPGLHIVAYRSSGDDLTYAKWEKFTSFLAAEGLDGVVERHRERGLPETGFKEAYVRYAKSLVQVGPVNGAQGDQRLGLALELVVGRSPYARGAATLPVRLYWLGEPLAGIQLTVFHDGEETVRTVLRTDDEGRAEVPLVPGRRYLLNAVHMEAVEGSDFVWLSHWASLTFEAAPQ